MKIVDVTLRDGGFVCDFDWNIDAARKHLRAVQQAGIHVVELGYWKQVAKSTKPFYSLDEDFLEILMEGVEKTADFSIMIDYHYCSHNPADYPHREVGTIDLVRLTSRKEDLVGACNFAERLKRELELDVSFQIINSTNYSTSELEGTVERILQTGSVSIIAFADSHGNLNFSTDSHVYHGAIQLIERHAVKWGFHLHNHTGRANLNFWLLRDRGCHYMDGSVNGLGKGGGNLHLEEIVSNENLPVLLDYMVQEADLPMRISKQRAYNILTGRANVTDNYAKLGARDDIPFKMFQNRLRKIRGVDKDTFREACL
jgi:4-hydroxy 2-oxovalerate aldolase